MEQTVDNIAEESEALLHWAWLHALLGDMPPPREVIDRLRSTLHQTDFEGLLEKNVELGLLAIQVASLQAKHLGDEELRLFLKEGLLKMARRLANLKTAEGIEVLRGNLNRQEDVHLELFEAALHISKAVQLSTNVTAEFADIAAQLLKAWPAMIPKYKPIIQQLCEELPIAQAQEFWSLAVQLRAVNE